MVKKDFEDSNIHLVLSRIEELQLVLSRVLPNENEEEIGRLAKMYIEDVGSAYDERLKEDLEKFKNGLPIQYITNVQYFYGHKFYINSSVLIPRPETEELVYWIESDHKHYIKPIKCLDIGTGSGVIPIALSKKFGQWELSGIDISASALEVAKKNGQDLSVNVEWIEQDILEEKSWEGSYDIIVSNPPYISLDEKSVMSKSTLKHEPHVALFSEDPMLFYRKISEYARIHLNLNGALYFELNEFYKDGVEQLLNGFFSSIEFKRDLQGKWRMAKAMLPLS